MTWPKTMQVVIFPQAFRIILPPLGNAFNGLMKTSSLASAISMEELLRRTELLVQVKFKVLELFCVAALYYLVLTTLWGFVQSWLEARASRSVTSPLQTSSPVAKPLDIDNAILFHDAS
jgi:polar amino acid transport system permease protein